MSSPAESCAALASQLAELGVSADVESEGSLAVLRPPSDRPDVPALDRATRAAIVDAARRCGFTHVALEL